MQRSIYMFFFSLLCLLLFAVPASAVHLGGGVYCVNDTTDLEADLLNDLNDVAIAGVDAWVRLI